MEPRTDRPPGIRDVAIEVNHVEGAQMETLHAVLGSIEVATTMVGRSTQILEGTNAQLVIAALRDAADALAAAAAAADRELSRSKALGPAA